MGLIIDRVNRVTAQAVAMTLAGSGYLSMALVSSPLDLSAWPAFALLGAGQLSALFSSQGLIGQEAPEKERGAIVGVFGFCGAVGILFATGVGGRLFDSIAPAAPFVVMGIANVVLLIWAIVVRIKAPGLMIKRS
jgi:MFS family permease